MFNYENGFINMYASGSAENSTLFACNVRHEYHAYQKTCNDAAFGYLMHV